MPLIDNILLLICLAFLARLASTSLISRTVPCQDTRDSCPGLCGLSFTYDQCRRSCNFCHEDCRDLSDFCGQIPEDICYTEDSKFHCRRYCGLCFPKVCSRTPYETSPLCLGEHWSEVAPSYNCYDESDDCTIASCLGSLYKHRCRRFCGFCRPVACRSYLGPHLFHETSPMCLNRTIPHYAHPDSFT